MGQKVSVAIACHERHTAAAADSTACQNQDSALFLPALCVGRAMQQLNAVYWSSTGGCAWAALELDERSDVCM